MGFLPVFAGIPSQAEDVIRSCGLLFASASAIVASSARVADGGLMLATAMRSRFEPWRIISMRSASMRPFFDA